MAFVITTEVRTDWLLGLRNLRRNLDQATKGAEGYFLKSSLKNELELQKYAFFILFCVFKVPISCKSGKKKKMLLHLIPFLSVSHCVGLQVLPFHRVNL